MEIHRFDAEVSRPIDAFGSGFRLGDLLDVRRARLAVLHLAAGGSIGEHPAAGRQLFAVLEGAGWVSGGDRERRGVRAGEAALWDPGERHAAGSPEGLTALSVEGDFTVLALRVTSDIEVVDHDPEWATSFARIREHLWPAVAHVARRIDHVGSTSVPGLAAKPIIDADVVVASDEDVPGAIEALAAVGYLWRGDLGVPGRESFVCPAGSSLPRHHLYLVVENNKAHVDHWLLGDVLRADPGARDRYGALKRKNAREAGRDVDYYVAAKAAFVADLLAAARAERGLPEAEYWVPDMARFGPRGPSEPTRQ